VTFLGKGVERRVEGGSGGDMNVEEEARAVWEERGGSGNDGSTT
jgi:hypothetical protein